MIALISLVGLILVTTISAYIPAVPTNASTASNEAISLFLIWNNVYSNGQFRTGLSKQLNADPADNTTIVDPLEEAARVARGVLVHFNETIATSQPPVTVDWIAMISCDTNGTVFSDVDDIFTLARDHGAQAALLYSLTAEGCSINTDYLNNFEKPLDVYATDSLQGARILENQFPNTASHYDFDSKLLNDSALAIQTLINATALIVASPAGANATVQLQTVTDPPTPTPTVSLNSSISGILATETDSISDSTPDPTSSLGSIPSTATETTPPTTTMLRVKRSTPSSASASVTPTPTSFLIAIMARNLITTTNSTANDPSQTPISGGNSPPSTVTTILYAFTSVVTLMFVIVVLAGAIRAMRNPERYGPRSSGLDGFDGPARTRAGGITRAILDTFPIVQFRRSDPNGDATTTPPMKDVEAVEEVEMTRVMERDPVLTRTAVDQLDTTPSSSSSHTSSPLDSTTVESTNAVASTSAPPPPPVLHIDDQTCSICLSPFTEGEEIRVLPCDGRHKFHKDCIDPWLLDVSRLCPLCRLDLAGTSTGGGGGGEGEESEEEERREQQVISNLRAMLNDRNRSGSGVGGGGDSTAKRFFSYVAAKRRTLSNVTRERRGTNPSIPISRPSSGEGGAEVNGNGTAGT